MWKQKEARACYFGKNPAAYKYTIYIILQLSSNSKTRSRQAAASKVVEVVVGDGGREEVGTYNKQSTLMGLTIWIYKK